MVPTSSTVKPETIGTSKTVLKRCLPPPKCANSSKKPNVAQRQAHLSLTTPIANDPTCKVAPTHSLSTITVARKRHTVIPKRGDGGVLSKAEPSISSLAPFENRKSVAATPFLPSVAQRPSTPFPNTIVNKVQVPIYVPVPAQSMATLATVPKPTPSNKLSATTKANVRTEVVPHAVASATYKKTAPTSHLEPVLLSNRPLHTTSLPTIVKLEQKKLVDAKNLSRFLHTVRPPSILPARKIQNQNSCSAHCLFQQLCMQHGDTTHFTLLNKLFSTDLLRCLSTEFHWSGSQEVTCRHPVLYTHQEVLRNYKLCLLYHKGDDVYLRVIHDTFAFVIEIFLPYAEK